MTDTQSTAVLSETKLQRLKESEMTADAVVEAERYAEDCMQDTKMQEQASRLMWVTSVNTGNLEWMMDAGFRRTTSVQSSWSAEDVQKLWEAAKALRNRSQDMPTDKMQADYYLSHHVMSKKFNEKECADMVFRLRARLVRQSAGSAPMPEESDGDEDAADERADGEESADEVFIRAQELESEDDGFWD